MKGLLFDHYNIGHGGPDGFVHYGYNWCVEHEGKKYHISQENCETRIHYYVKPCDGSCEKGKEDLPSYIEKAFLEKVKTL
ncbi:hypothetical protein KKF60_01640 [Patescibacteria group bacterium]|nr:hypothetical protein [Patescibacteria group bacterium]MBU4458584.1 hypothetical protein [Patescibacteria group bacterium]MCG2696112.1 hypothetical protein [Candidatus Portnoybacteria bacterium]